MQQGYVMALAEHDVVIEIMTQVFPQLQRVLIKLTVTRHHVIGTHNSGVTPRITAA